MAYEVRDNSGSMFPNDRKERDSHPDFKGSVMIDGIQYWISGWEKQAQSGKQFVSLAFQRKEESRNAAPREPKLSERAMPKREAETYGASRDMDDDIPFAPEFR